MNRTTLVQSVNIVDQYVTIEQNATKNRVRGESLAKKVSFKTKAIFQMRTRRPFQPSSATKMGVRGGG